MNRQSVYTFNGLAGTALLGLVLTCMAPTASCDSELKTYIIVLDGFRGDYIGMNYDGGAHSDTDVTPRLSELKSQGTSYKMYNLLPAFTATNHVAIVTAARAGTSGILGAGGGYQGKDTDNTLKARTYTHDDLHVRGVVTLFNAAYDGDTKYTAVVAGKLWIGDVFKDEDVDTNITPDGTNAYILGGPPHAGDDLSKPRVLFPYEGMSPPLGFEYVYDLDGEMVGSDDFPSDQWVIDQALWLIDSEDPDLFYILMANMDEAGHAYGALHDGSVANLHQYRNADAVRDQIWITDSLVGFFVDSLKNIDDGEGKSRFDNSIILITSDHGMSSMKDSNYSLDLRQELEDGGFPMRIKDGHVNEEYNPDGVYDYCITEGPAAYIYDDEDTTLHDLLDFLQTGLPNIDGVYPIDEIYYGESRDKLFGGPPTDHDLAWPDIIIIFEPNIPVYLYGDEIEKGINAFHLQVPELFTDHYGDALTIKTVPGEHGCQEERHVPCILVGGGVAQGMENVFPNLGIGLGYSGPVGPGGDALPGGTTFYHNIGIAPALCELNAWPIPPEFEGGSIISSLPITMTNGTDITGPPEYGTDFAEFSYCPDLIGGDWTYLDFDDDASDGYGYFWNPDMFPRGDFLIKMQQFPSGTEETAHVYSMPYGSGQLLFSDHFEDGDIGNWIIEADDGQIEIDSIEYVTGPCGLRMFSQGEGHARAFSPEIPVDTTKDFTIATHFMVPDYNNHWFAVLDNNWVHIVIDYLTELKAWQGSNGGILPIASLTPGQWYWIRAEVHPASQNYDIYLDGVYMATAHFLRDSPGSVRLNIKIGDFITGSYDHGEACWDGLTVLGYKMIPQEPYECGDANGDGQVNVGDAVFLISYVFKGGPGPDPVEAGDANCDSGVNVGDAVYIISYVFKGGPEPCCP